MEIQRDKRPIGAFTVAGGATLNMDETNTGSIAWWSNTNLMLTIVLPGRGS